MVLMFMLYNESKKNQIKLSFIYESKYNDEKKFVRESYIRDKITQEYLFLCNIDYNKDLIKKNKNISSILNEIYIDKVITNNENKYEGIILIENNILFSEQQNVFWKFYEGHIFVLVCSVLDNILMASNFLSVLITFAKPDLLEAPENFSVILDALLPSGQLLFLTEKAANELVKSHLC